jgi:hypothetical protein
MTGPLESLAVSKTRKVPEAEVEPTLSAIS